MKLALLASLLTFGGSLAGFGIVSGGASSPVAATPPPAAQTEHVVVSGESPDCPKARAGRT